jgi:hypothetical protein
MFGQDSSCYVMLRHVTSGKVKLRQEMSDYFRLVLDISL